MEKRIRKEKPKMVSGFERGLSTVLWPNFKTQAMVTKYAIDLMRDSLKGIKNKKDRECAEYFFGAAIGFVGSFQFSMGLALMHDCPRMDPFKLLALTDYLKKVDVKFYDDFAKNEKLPRLIENEERFDEIMEEQQRKESKEIGRAIKEVEKGVRDYKEKAPVVSVDHR
jgi:hypothetical protein